MSFFCLHQLAYRIAPWSGAEPGPQQWPAPQVAQWVKNPPVNAGDSRDEGSIPGLERAPETGTGNSFQYSSLDNSMNRGAWQATVHRVAKSSDTTEVTRGRWQCQVLTTGPQGTPSRCLPIRRWLNELWHKDDVTQLLKRMSQIYVYNLEECSSYTDRIKGNSEGNTFIMTSFS